MTQEGVPNQATAVEKQLRSQVFYVCVLRPPAAPGNPRGPQESTPGASRSFRGLQERFGVIEIQEASWGPQEATPGASLEAPGGPESVQEATEETSALDLARMSEAKLPFSENRVRNH